MALASASSSPSPSEASAAAATLAAAALASRMAAPAAGGRLSRAGLPPRPDVAAPPMAQSGKRSLPRPRPPSSGAAAFSALDAARDAPDHAPVLVVGGLGSPASADSASRSTTLSAPISTVCTSSPTLVCATMVSSTPVEAPPPAPAAIAEASSMTPAGNTASSTTPAGTTAPSLTPVEVAPSSTPVGAEPGLNKARYVSWSSLTDNEDEEDDDVLAPPPPATKSSVPAAQPGMACDADSCGGWQKVMPRRNVQCPVSLRPALAPRPIPAWLHGRCCRCLYPGHRAAECRDPFRCSRCLENGHRARGCRNAWRPLSFLGRPTLSPLPRLPVGHQQASVPCKVRKEVAPLSKTFGRDSWASIVAAPASSVASADIPVQPALERQAELLRSELIDMASFRFEETVQPLRDVVDSMQGWMLRMESFIERVEAALGGLSLAPLVLQSAHVLHPLIVPDGSFEVERGDELHGCFSPRARASSPPSAYEGLGNDVVVTPVLQIMPELRELCGGSVLPLSIEQPKVMPVSDMTIEPIVLAPTSNPDALFAKELCDLLASVEVARPGLGRSIACLLTGTPIRGKQKKVGKGKSGAMGKASLAA
ncbi:hypothetical protein ACQJBY_037589 [Aegilops geniculata]